MEVVPYWTSGSMLSRRYGFVQGRVVWRIGMGLVSVLAVRFYRRCSFNRYHIPAIGTMSPGIIHRLSGYRMYRWPCRADTKGRRRVDSIVIC